MAPAAEARTSGFDPALDNRFQVIERVFLALRVAAETDAGFDR
jgi:hypothetical protein